MDNKSKTSENWLRAMANLHGTSSKASSWTNISWPVSGKVVATRALTIVATTTSAFITTVLLVRQHRVLDMRQKVSETFVTTPAITAPESPSLATRAAITYSSISPVVGSTRIRWSTRPRAQSLESSTIYIESTRRTTRSTTEINTIWLAIQVVTLWVSHFDVTLFSTNNLLGSLSGLFGWLFRFKNYKTEVPTTLPLTIERSLDVFDLQIWE